MGSSNRLGRVHNAPKRHLKNQVNAPAPQGSFSAFSAFPSGFSPGNILIHISLWRSTRKNISTNLFLYLYISI